MVRNNYLFLLCIFLSCHRAGNISSEGSFHPGIRELEAWHQQDLAPEHFQQWVKEPEHGLLQTKKIDNVEYSLLCKPVDYIISKEAGNGKVSASEYARKIEELSDLIYFDLRIKIDHCNGEFLKYGVSSSEEYQDRVAYSAFAMQQDIRLVSGGDSIPCSLFHFERAFDVVPYGNFLMGFSADPATLKDLTFVFHDNLLQKGIIKFSVDPRLLTHLPKLKTS